MTVPTSPQNSISVCQSRPLRANKLLRVDRPDAADHPGAQVFLDALDCCRCGCLEKRSPELDAVRAVVDPASICLDELAGGDHRRMPDEGDEIALTSCFDSQ